MLKEKVMWEESYQNMWKPLLDKFIQQLPSIPITSSRKNYSIPFKTLLTWIGQSDLLNKMTRAKQTDKNSFRQELTTVLSSHVSQLHEILKMQLQNYEITFTRLLTRFSRSPYMNARLPTISNSRPSANLGNNNLKADRNVTHINHSDIWRFDQKLPVGVQIVLQSSLPKGSAPFPTNTLSNVIKKFVSETIYLEHSIKECKECKDDSKKQTFLTSILQEKGTEKFVKSLFDILNLIGTQKEVFIINLSKWREISLPFRTGPKDNGLNFCHTSLFESYSKTWFPWMTSVAQFSDMLTITQKTDELNLLLQDFTSDTFSIAINAADHPCCMLWNELTIYDKYMLGFYAKTQLKTRTCPEILPPQQDACPQKDNLDAIAKDWKINLFVITPKKRIFTSKLIGSGSELWTIILYQNSPETFQVVNVTDEALPIIGSYKVPGTPLMWDFDFSQKKKTEKWMKEWNEQFWPSANDVLRSYEKDNFVLYPIVETQSEWKIDSIALAKNSSSPKQSYERAYFMLKSLIEFGYQEISFQHAMEQRWVFTPQGVIDLYLMEKKLLFLHESLHTTPESLSLRNHIRSIDDGYQSSQIIMRQSHLDDMLLHTWLTGDDVIAKQLSPDDICYLTVRLQNFSLQSKIYLSLASYIFLQSETRDISTIDGPTIQTEHFMDEPLLLKMDSFGKPDTIYAATILSLYQKWKQGTIDIQSWNTHVNECLVSHTTFLTVPDKVKKYSKLSRKITITSKNSSNQRAISEYRTLPYPIILNPETQLRLNFPDRQGEAQRKLGNGRYVISIHKGNRTAKLYPKKDFQWNDLASFEDKVSGERFEKELLEVDNLKPSLHIETVNNHKQVKTNYQLSMGRYYTPTTQDRHYRATFYDLYHPSSRSGILEYLQFLDIYLIEALQNVFYECVMGRIASNTGSIQDRKTILLELCYLLWEVYVRKEYVPDLPHLDVNVSTSTLNWVHFYEKLNGYFGNVGNFIGGEEEMKSWDTFYRVLSIVYPRMHFTPPEQEQQIDMDVEDTDAAAYSPTSVVF